MTDLKEALNAGNDTLAVTLASNMKEIVTTARGSKTRIRTATRVFVLHESSEGDAQIAKWTRQKAAEAAMLGLWDLVRTHREVDRFCELLGERLLEGLTSRVWHFCIETLLLMHRPEALGYVLNAAEKNSHGPGTLSLLARGGDLKHEAERVKNFLRRWENSDMLGHATRDWILAKLGNVDAYNALVELCLNGPMDASNAMRAAQALSHIHGWNAPWGAEGTEIVRAKLRENA